MKKCKDESSNLVQYSESKLQSPNGKAEKIDIDLSQRPNGEFEKIDIDKYIKGRVLKKIEFFNCLKDREKNRYGHYQYSIIIIGAIITIVNAILSHPDYSFFLRSFTAVLGASVIAITSIVSFNKYQEKMLSFKIALRTLEKEYNLFLFSAGVYSNLKTKGEKNTTFVSRIEDILEKEALDYVAILTPDRKGEDTEKLPSVNDGDKNLLKNETNPTETK